MSAVGMVCGLSRLPSAGGDVKSLVSDFHRWVVFVLITGLAGLDVVSLHPNLVSKDKDVTRRVSWVQGNL